jgi:hypothetical protein
LFNTYTGLTSAAEIIPNPEAGNSYINTNAEHYIKHTYTASLKNKKNTGTFETLANYSF